MTDVEIKTKDIFGTEIHINGEKLDLNGIRAFSLTQEAGEFPNFNDAIKKRR